jgi:hypothetical protein
MLLLEIGYSEKYDTFTGYVCKQSTYFNYEVNRDKVELSPIRQSFTTYKDFVAEFSKSNPHARFLTDPIEIRDLNYRDLKRYQSLALTTQNGHWIPDPFNTLKKFFIILAALCLAAGVYFGGRKYYTPDIQQELIIPFKTTAETESIQYYYEIRLLKGGFIDGFDLKQNEDKIFITNRKGLDVTIDLSSIQYIEKVAVGNPLTREVLYGNKQ